MTWKKLNSKEVYKNRWIRVTEDEVETDKGKHFTYGVVHKQPFALIIPWNGERLTVVGQYRYIVGSYSWEFPQGHYEHSNIEETAREELREETGLRADAIQEIGSLWLGPGAIAQECKIFMATNLQQGERHLEESEEGMECKAVTLEEFWEMVSNGSIKDAPTLAAFALEAV